MGVLAEEPLVAGLLREHGLEEVRRAWPMTITFDRAPAPPIAFRVSRSVRCRRATRSRSTSVSPTPSRTTGESHSRHTEQWLHRHMTGAQQFDPTLWWIAWQNRQVVGALVAHPDAEEDPGLAYVGVLGVRRPARCQGIGEALLRTSFQAFARRGKRGAQLHVDSQSLTGATRLYERVGMTAQPRFATWEKQLRP